MTSMVSRILALACAAALASCATVQDVMPDWMPGSGSFRVAEDGTISGSITTENVQGTMAHIHQGAKGINGPVIVPLDKKGDTYSVPAGRKLTPAQVKALQAGNLYVNVHSARYKGGEVRAQLLP